MKLTISSVCCFVTIFLGSVVALSQSQYKVLYSFGSNSNDGSLPNGGLVFDKTGNLYGTTQYGGTGTKCQFCGTVFELSPSQDGSWTESVIYNFCTQPGCPDGEEPAAGLVFDSQGNLYGTTVEGGANQLGTVFKLSPGPPGTTWTETILWSFGNGPNDGGLPYSQLIWDASGNLYGTTSGGNGNAAGGSVFQLSPNGDGGWSETILHGFCPNGLQNCSDGFDPMAGVSFDRSGNLYGTTYAGGFDNKWGVLYELSPESGVWREKILYKFTGTGGGQPMSTVAFDPGGNAYVTAYGGSANSAGECGGVFRFVPAGKKSSYLFFPTGTGCNPAAGVFLDDRAQIAYGTTVFGGDRTVGDIYRVSAKGGTILYNFCSEDSCTDGAYPTGSLTLHGSKLYSTTSQGGEFNHGVVFEIASQ
jgi:uncharacterized repeat protein (TIGR03803 family)